MPPLQALSRLADLRLAQVSDLQLADLLLANQRLAFEDESSDELIESAGGGAPVLTASMLSGAASLTCLELQSMKMDPGVLAGQTQLQHLAVDECVLPWEALLLQLGSLQQLTHLRCAYLFLLAAPLPAAHSALTASSNLQALVAAPCRQACGSTCSLPAGSCRT